MVDCVRSLAVTKACIIEEKHMHIVSGCTSSAAPLMSFKESTFNKEWGDIHAELDDFPSAYSVQTE